MVSLTGIIGAIAVGLSGASQSLPRIVSLDFCADQYVLALAEPDQILALSVQADDAHSALRDRAVGHAQVRAAAEDVLALQPDLIVRSYGGDARAMAFYERLGLSVHQLGYASDFDAIGQTLRHAAEALGQVERGEALIAQMQNNLAQAGQGRSINALYLTPSGATTGAGTMIHTLFEAANIDNVGAQDGMVGWRTLPLEHLAYQQPDYVVTSFFDDGAAARDSWAVSSHSVFKGVLDKGERINLDGAMSACATWLLADAALSIRKQINDQAGRAHE